MTKPAVSLSSLFAGALLLIAASTLLWYVTPEVTPEHYQLPKNTTRSYSLPLTFEESNRVAKVLLRLDLGSIYPTHYDVHTDDCLQALEVNGQAIPFQRPLCTYPLADRFDLSPFLASGQNQITAYVRNHSGQGVFHLSPARTDPLLLTIRLVVGSLLSVGLLLALRKFPGWNHYRPLYVCFLIGLTVRLLYFSVTPPELRAHDAHAHRDYANYVSENWKIPPYDLGWETHQPPLYYFLVAPLRDLHHSLGGMNISLDRLYQVPSCVIGVLTLLVSLYLGSLLFRGTNTRLNQWIYGGLLAVFPGFIYPSARIGNDSLCILLVVAVIASLVRWWRSVSSRAWLLGCVVFGLALLTKANALFVWPVIMLCVAFHPQLQLGRKIVHGLYGLLIPILIAGWLYYDRYVVHGQISVIGDVYALSGDLVLTRTPGNFFVFNPIAILQHPYVHTFLDSTRRSNFWEVLFRTAHFGEWDFSHYELGLTQILLFFGMQLTAISLIGMYYEYRHNRAHCLPVLILVPLVLSAHLFGRYLYPYGPISDFRFIAYLTVPFAYFTAVAVGHMKGVLSAVFAYVSFTTLALYTVFLALLYLASTPSYAL